MEPLWRHVELALVFWLAVFGGADVVSARVFAVDAAIVSEHHKAARARARRQGGGAARGAAFCATRSAFVRARGVSAAKAVGLMRTRGAWRSPPRKAPTSPPRACA